MASSLTNLAQSSFMDSLKWLRCQFCLKEFEGVQFYYLLCSTVACKECVMKMRSRSVRDKIDCTHCNQTVAACQIHEKMPQHLRIKFEKPEKILQDAISSAAFQQQLRDSIQKQLIDENLRLKNDFQRINDEAVRFHRKTEQFNAEFEEYREKILKGIPAQQIGAISPENHRLSRPNLKSNRSARASTASSHSSIRSNSPVNSGLNHDDSQSEHNH